MYKTMNEAKMNEATMNEAEKYVEYKQNFSKYNNYTMYFFKY